jgi:F0F1-type ATP synthase assembly protein I
MGAASGSSAGLRLAGAGIQFAAVLVGCVFLGQWMDRRFGTDPIGVFVGAALGAVGGMTALYRQLMRVQRDEEAARKR